MAHIAIGRRDGKWFFDAQGCCGDVAAQRRFYDRAHAVQVLEEGGRLSAWDGAGFELVDRKGRPHRYPRSWAEMTDRHLRGVLDGENLVSQGRRERQ